MCLRNRSIAYATRLSMSTPRCDQLHAHFDHNNRGGDLCKAYRIATCRRCFVQLQAQAPREPKRVRTVWRQR